MAAPNVVTATTVEQISINSPDGTTLGASTSEKISFYGVTPVAQLSATAQSAVATTAITTVVTTAATSTSPYGFATAAQADAIVAAVNSLISRGSANTTLVNQIRADLVTVGLIKGSA